MMMTMTREVMKEDLVEENLRHSFDGDGERNDGVCAGRAAGGR